MTNAILNEYKKTRVDLSYPAKSALYYAKRYARALELESEFDVEIIISPEEIAPEDHLMEVDAHMVRRAMGWNDWAWCVVEVRVSAYGETESSYLGACSYKDEEDFKRGGYYADMIEECIDLCQRQSEENQEGEH